MGRKEFQGLLLSSEISKTELTIVMYLLDMCNEWGFTTESASTIAGFFGADTSNTYARIRKLKKLEVIKEVEYNGRKGLMVSPIYCYAGSLKLRRFRSRLWSSETLYTKVFPNSFYGPPVLDRKTLVYHSADKVGAKKYIVDRS